MTAGNEPPMRDRAELLIGELDNLFDGFLPDVVFRHDFPLFPLKDLARAAVSNIRRRRVWRQDSSVQSIPGGFMSRLHRITIAALVVGGLFTSCRNDREAVGPNRAGAGRSGISAPDDAHYTMGSGSVSTALGRATFADPDNQTFNIKRKTGDWDIQIKSKPAFDIAVQSIDFQAAGQSGWHRHPGPVFIQVVLGTMTFYESDDPTCTPIVKTAGQGYLDLGERAHYARNESGAPARTVVTYFAPPGEPLKIDEPNPGNCPF